MLVGTFLDVLFFMFVRTLLFKGSSRRFYFFVFMQHCNSINSAKANLLTIRICLRREVCCFCFRVLSGRLYALLYIPTVSVWVETFSFLLSSFSSERLFFLCSSWQLPLLFSQAVCTPDFREISDCENTLILILILININIIITLISASWSAALSLS